MKVFALYENDKLVALCVERIAAGTLIGELYYPFNESTIVTCEVEVPDDLWQMLEANRETYPEGY